VIIFQKTLSHFMTVSDYFHRQPYWEHPNPRSVPVDGSLTELLKVNLVP
jgi:hypothetical protein